MKNNSLLSTTLPLTSGEVYQLLCLPFLISPYIIPKAGKNLNLVFPDPNLLLIFRILFRLCANHLNTREIIMHKNARPFNMQMIFLYKQRYVKSFKRQFLKSDTAKESTQEQAAQEKSSNCKGFSSLLSYMSRKLYFLSGLWLGTANNHEVYLLSFLISKMKQHLWKLSVLKMRNWYIIGFLFVCF